jgi:hypothetical protein
MTLAAMVNGNVLISKNTNLCFAETINWGIIFSTTGIPPKIVQNRNATNCRKLPCQPDLYICTYFWDDFWIYPMNNI